MAAISPEKQRSAKTTTTQSSTANPSNLPCTSENDVEMGKSTLSPTIQPTKPPRRKTGHSIVDDNTFVGDRISTEILPSCSTAQHSEAKTEHQIISSSDVATTMTQRQQRAIDELAVQNIELSRLMASVYVS